jgi:hypothetical protein
MSVKKPALVMLTTTPTPVPDFLKGVPKEHWEGLCNAVMKSRWAQHRVLLQDLTQSLPQAYRDGLVQDLLTWKEEAQMLLDMGILNSHQVGMAKMLSMLDIKGQVAAFKYCKKYPINNPL